MDPYLSEHEHDIDKALEELQTQAMAMGMRYIKQGMQLAQNLVLDLVRKVTDGVHKIDMQMSQPPKTPELILDESFTF